MAKMNSIRKSALIKPLAAHEQAEMLAKKKSGSAVERFLVKPDYAYPNTRMNRDELRVEMNKPSASFHDLRLPSSNEIGLLKLEVLQCIGLPSLDAVGENDMFCLAVCGSYAFKTDIMPPTANPMWLSKMRRACIFPLFHAYAKLMWVHSITTMERGMILLVGLFLTLPECDPIVHMMSHYR
jgi:hypothetical protein